MRVQAEVLYRVAELARLRLEPEEAERLRQELSGILDHMDGLAQIDSLAQVDGLIEAYDLARKCDPTPERTHQPVPNGSAEESTSTPHPPPGPLPADPSRLAPRWEDGFFVVPRLPAMDGTMDPPPPPTDPSPGEGEKGG